VCPYKFAGTPGLPDELSRKHYVHALINSGLRIQNSDFGSGSDFPVNYGSGSNFQIISDPDQTNYIFSNPEPFWIQQIFLFKRNVHFFNFFLPTLLIVLSSVPDTKLIISDPDPHTENQEFRILILIRILDPDPSVNL